MHSYEDDGRKFLEAKRLRSSRKIKLLILKFCFIILEGWFKYCLLEMSQRYRVTGPLSHDLDVLIRFRLPGCQEVIIFDGGMKAQVKTEKVSFIS